MPGRRASLTNRDLRPLFTTLHRVNTAFGRAYPGESGDRQPVHTVYGGAHLFRSDSAQKLGAVALSMLDEYAPDGASLGRVLGLATAAGDAFGQKIRARIVEKLRREPVEDYRIDFEDGYGNRPDHEEDAHAQSSAREVAVGLDAGTLPPFIGIRIKPMSNELCVRSVRTLDLFVTELCAATRRRLPAGFVVTVPKVVAPGQVEAIARACAALERRLRLRPGALKLELMIETPQSILAPDGSCAVRGLVAAGGGRVSGAHFGTYDYTALCGVTASWQHMRHPACDFAKNVLQVALAQTGVKISDGATNVMPVPPHRATADHVLTDEQRRENAAAVHRAWKIHFDDVRHSLVGGFYQGWDLHPAQLPTRYAAVFDFFLSARAAATARLRHFIDEAAQATLVGDVFDDAATGQGLLNFFVRGLNSGALTMGEALETGLSLDELQGRSFLKILESRRPRAAGRAAKLV